LLKKGHTRDGATELTKHACCYFKGREESSKETRELFKKKELKRENVHGERERGVWDP